MRKTSCRASTATSTASDRPRSLLPSGPLQRPALRTHPRSRIPSGPRLGRKQARVQVGKHPGGVRDDQEQESGRRGRQHVQKRQGVRLRPHHAQAGCYHCRGQQHQAKPSGELTAPVAQGHPPAVHQPLHGGRQGHRKLFQPRDHQSEGHSLWGPQPGLQRGD